MVRYEKAIIKTLLYGSIFCFPLTKGEVWKYLIWEERRKPKIAPFLYSLKLLTDKKRIFQIKKYFLLSKNQSWIIKREGEEKRANRKMAIAKKVVRILKIIPTILFIGLTGKLALGIAQKDDDIDLLIITEANYLWTTRLLVVVILIFLGIKREPNQNRVNNKICVNMFIDSNHLCLSKDERDLFSAHEISQMRPLYDKNNSYFKFLKSNFWVKKDLPNSIRLIPQIIKLFQRSSKRETVYERFVKKLQFWYMQKKRTTEVIKKGYVRFHPHDARQWILTEYNKLTQGL